MKLQKEKYLGYVLYFYDEKYKEIGKKIIEKQYREIQRLKDTARNFVSVIEIDAEKFIYKEPRNEYRLLQRRYMSFIKKGECLNSLINITYLREELKITEYIKPFLAIVKRQKGMICYSSLLMEYSSGVSTVGHFDMIVDIMKRIHKLRYYHGDCNPSNFLLEEKGKQKYIRVLDTQGKKMGLTKYRAHYDMLTLKLDSYQEMEYPYTIDIAYHVALCIKKMKKLKCIKWLKDKRRVRRERKK